MLTKLRKIWEKNWPEVNAALRGGIPEFVFARNPKELGNAVPVFNYHVVSEARLQADIDFLSRNGYVPIDSDRVLDHLARRRAAPARAVCLTFDDGPLNLYEVAFPLLRASSLRVVAFVATRFHQDLSSCPDDGRAVGLRQRPLTWREIREMHNSGVVDFQSHTHEHRYLPRWPEPAPLEGSVPEEIDSMRGPGTIIEEDFRKAKRTLERKLDKTVRHLAFARFKGTPEAVRIGRDLGYEAFWWGVLPRRACNRPGDDPAQIVRLDARYLRRLPGNGRSSLNSILRSKYGGSLTRLRRALRRH